MSRPAGASDIRPTVGRLAEILGGRLLGSDGAASVGPACIDTRRLVPGDLFVALEGDNTDGHAFLEQAHRAGALAALVRDGFEERGFSLPSGLAALVVADPLAALTSYAAYLRQESAAVFVGLTGSNGKTTTKEMLASILNEAAGPQAVVKTEGNLNNHIGVPLTLSRIDGRVRYAVVEMGMNHPGEIAHLAGIARPSLGLITSIGRAHLEFLGSLEGVARAKAELFEALPVDGYAIYPEDQPILAEKVSHLPPGRRWTFGTTAGAKMRLVERRETADGQHIVLSWPSGRLELDLSAAGRHNALDAAAAAAAALALGLEPRVVRAGLSAFRPAAHRSVLTRIGGALVLDDCYNANPSSMEAALTALAEMEGRSGAILGDMAELGPDSVSLHRSTLEVALNLGFERLVLVGPLMAEAAASLSGRMDSEHLALFRDALQAGEQAARWFVGGWNVLVKASRTTGLERALERWRSLAEPRR